MLHLLIKKKPLVFIILQICNLLICILNFTKMTFKFHFYWILLFLVEKIYCNVHTCSISDVNSYSSNNHILSIQPKLKRYLLYEVNPGEGFNLRRDVYMRIAVLVKKLNEFDKKCEWTLVLPPWGPLYHWKSRDIGYQDQIKWSKFFDLGILKRYVSVMELPEFIKEHGPVIEKLYYLQHYAEGWSDSKWEEKVDIKDCIEDPPYKKVQENKFRGWFWGDNQLFAKDVQCLSIQGYSSTLKQFLLFTSYDAVMIDKAEVILHDNFGDTEYWKVRRSMVFSKRLISIGNEFRKNNLYSTDESDKIEKSTSLSSPIERKALGGPYISVHLRRQDFVKVKSKEVPSIEFAAKQILEKMNLFNLKVAFISSDASKFEFEELKKYIPGAKHFIPSKDIHKEILDGGVAIVDQWISAHARYFIGTHESTFSFRIQEEREILGFPAHTTFNRLCGNNQTQCVQPSKWTIVFK